MKIDNGAYPAEAVIGYYEGRGAALYDLVDFRKQEQRRSSGTVLAAQSESDRRLGASFDISIADGDGDVKGKSLFQNADEAVGQPAKPRE